MMQVLQNRHIMRAAVLAVLAFLGVMLFVAMLGTRPSVAQTQAQPIAPAPRLTD